MKSCMSVGHCCYYCSTEKPKSKVDTLSHFTFLDSRPLRNSSSKELILEPGYLRGGEAGESESLWTVGWGDRVQEQQRCPRAAIAKRGMVNEKEQRGSKCCLDMSESGIFWSHVVRKQCKKALLGVKTVWQGPSVFTHMATTPWKEQELVAHSFHRYFLDPCYIHSKF